MSPLATLTQMSLGCPQVRGRARTQSPLASFVLKDVGQSDDGDADSKAGSESIPQGSGFAGDASEPFARPQPLPKAGNAGLPQAVGASGPAVHAGAAVSGAQSLAVALPSAEQTMPGGTPAGCAMGDGATRRAPPLHGRQAGSNDAKRATLPAPTPFNGIAGAGLAVDPCGVRAPFTPLVRVGDMQSQDLGAQLVATIESNATPTQSGTTAGSASVPVRPYFDQHPDGDEVKGDRSLEVAFLDETTAIIYPDARTDFAEPLIVQVYENEIQFRSASGDSGHYEHQATPVFMVDRHAADTSAGSHDSDRAAGDGNWARNPTTMAGSAGTRLPENARTWLVRDAPDRIVHDYA